MSRVPIADGRLRAFFVLLLPMFVGHTIQLLTEDIPWTELAMRRYWVTPGWHLALPPEVPLGIGVALGLAVIATVITRNRVAFLILTACYAAHYLTYPWRIRNHMTTMLGGLGIVSLVWLVARASGALTGERPRARQVDRIAVTGLAAVIVTQYFYAGLHKMNPTFADPTLDGPSGAMMGLTSFWQHGDLGYEPPMWARMLAIWGTMVIEVVVPIVAWRVRRLTIPAVLVLLLFHVPHVSAMDVADYPMIASTYYLALFSRGQWRIVSRHLRPSAWTITGAAIGAATQVWFIPWWGPMNDFGVFVLALWGLAAGAMLRAVYSSYAARRSRRIERPAEGAGEAQKDAA